MPKAARGWRRPFPNIRSGWEAWLVNRFNGSVFEFAIDPSLEKSSEGVAITADKRAISNAAPEKD